MESILGEFRPFPMFFRHTVEAGEVQGGLEERDPAAPSLLLLSLLPSVAILFPEWSVSTGSAQDEMSYLRLILIS